MVQEKWDKVIEAAKLYYLLDYNQHDIAGILGVSRPTVSRMLKMAKDEGIVQITIRDNGANSEELAKAIQEKYGLKKVIVSTIPQYQDLTLKSHLGQSAAEYLNSIVKDGDIVGVTWGTTVYHTAVELKQTSVKDVTVVQLKGGVSHSETNTYASEILYLFGKAFNTTPLNLPLPAIVDHVVVKQAVMADRHIGRTIQIGKNSNIALFTCGPIKHDSLLFQLGYFSDDDLEMIDNKAVGDICSRFFDENGQICNPSLNERTLGIDLEELKQKDYSILIAGGAQKVESINAALKGKFANVLITDQFTAQMLIEMK
ncbi:sugar-binding transcriptional regulator [Peribacillus acanthi]|uniref:sugar-binding transcriptional regulator n=1 Tax=Peribacillus acanthi TaxID=2171554 RepID=UPI000D3ED1C0|nr:sugar-binding transcriptional regulator [Peribacillus acanthi]